MYEALYRKYRPRTFDEVAGQEYITETLKNQVRTGRLSHAYLFIGTRGTGKTTCARILAKAVNCEHPVDGNPCNTCASCRGIDDGSVMDVVELDAASNNGVDDVRMLRDEAVFSPTTVRKRVYIIDEVHMLSKPAFNALLKILEEPPQHLMFILATTELNKVLPTILSRCQRHSFRRLDSETIAKRLLYVAKQEGIDLTTDAAEFLGRLADGGMRDGLSLLDQCSAAQTVDTDAVLHAMGLAGSFRTQALADSIINRSVSDALEQYEALWRDGKEPATLLNELAGLFRDALLLRLAPKGGADLISGAYSREALESVSVPDGELLRFLNTLQRYQSSMSGAANPRLQGELCVIELCGVSAQAPVSRPIPEAPPPQGVRSPERPEKPALQKRDLENHSRPPAGGTQDPAEKHVSVPPPRETPPIKGPAPDSAVFWNDVLSDLRSVLLKGTLIVLGDPSMVTGEFAGSELVLKVVPGFQTEMVTQPDIINKIRQSASRIAGSPVQVRVEEKKASVSLNNDKLDKLGQFSNVTIR